MLSLLVLPGFGHKREQKVVFSVQKDKNQQFSGPLHTPRYSPREGHFPAQNCQKPLFLVKTVNNLSYSPVLSGNVTPFSPFCQA